MTSDEIHEVLTSLGYKLQDRGSYWQTTAVFRQGDNQTALQIYKDTGVWRDFVNQTPPLRFERLIEKSLGEDSPEVKKILKNKNIESLIFKRDAPEQKLEMEETYTEDCLKKLLPHYRFYNDRGISDTTLKTLSGGLATQGQMYQRFVFPIYNDSGQIHGFSGRDMLDKEGRPKWKHVGRKSKWVYPAYLKFKEGSFLDAIEESGSVILVESIGDLLALHEHGYYNTLVGFGLDISPALVAVLVQINPSQIIISFNNDTGGSHNRGLDAAIKNYLKLLSYFDYQKLFICLPTENDFGDMKAESFEKWSLKLDDLKPESHCQKVLAYSETLANRKQISKKLIKNRNILAAASHE
jgi:hypothetical protein